MLSTFAMFSFTAFLIVMHSLLSISVIEATDIFTFDCSSSDFATAFKERLNSLNDSESSNNFFVVSKVYTREPDYSLKPQPCHHKKQFTYGIPVSPGPKLIRFHFNPTSYPGFHISKALFSVSAGHYTLLKIPKTSYSKNELDAGLGYTVKEFCINTDGDDQMLNVTFIPSLEVPNSYAFVNKIEVVSMPSNLYIREAIPLPLIGHPSPYYINNSRALEMMHRLNIGGDLIPVQEDSGMLRKWLPDASFLMTEVSGTGIIYSDVHIKFSSEVEAYVAPEHIYASARTVAAGSYHGVARWSLPVDTGFYYLVRLHFCEISKEIKQVNQRAFQVSITNLTAEDQADVFNWGHGSGIPVYRDYIVNFSEHTGGRKHLLLTIQNSNGSSIKIYRPAILNGLEIFKLSNFNNSLAGLFLFETRKSSESLRIISVKKIAHIGTAILSTVYFLATLQMLYSLWLKRTFIQSQLSEDCQSFSFDAVKSATNNFSDDLLLGAGGYGKVYKGSFNGGNDVVAIKRANPCSHQGLHEFQTEISLLSQLRHCHIVSLIGCCKEKNEMIIVYDYMANGTLRDHLYNTKRPPLSWKRRLSICIGAARGLHYLHTFSNHKIIHRDVKSTNILLNKDYVAKVSDFGLSKIGPNMLTQSNTHVSTMVKGSFGYLDPEYYRRQKLTEKSDVYSFGVVLFEVLCAKPAVLPLRETMEEDPERESLAERALHCYRSGTSFDEIIDPCLIGKIDPTCFKTFTDVAIKCLANRGSERPTMGEVLWNLEQAWLQQETNGKGGDCGGEDTGNELPVDVDGKPQNGGSDPTPGVEFSDFILHIGH